MDVKFHYFWILFISLVSLSAMQRVHRTCDKCSRNPSSCRRISGLYTVTVLTEGSYNPVVEIPASACSINITELGSSRNYIGVKTSSNKGVINSYWALGQPGQYYGAGTRYAYDRASGNCEGSCIYAEGPTLETTIVQLLYYGQNPGIAYEFVLPNSVTFRPFDVTKSKVSGPSSSSLSSSSTSSVQSAPSSAASSASASGAVSRVASPKHQKHHRYRQHHKRRGYPLTIPAYRTNSVDSKREYYTGSQTSRSEGRPDVTAAQGGPVAYRNRVLPNQRNTYDYSDSKYGSHTLDGRGLSYTAAKSSDLRRPTNQKLERYVSGSSSRVRKIPAPQYRPAVYTNRLRYSKQHQPRYQSLTTKTTYLNEASRPVKSRYLKSGRSSSRGLERGRFRWKISGLTKCSRSCGGGVQNTNVVCVSLSGRKVVVTPDNCVSSLKPRVQTVECNTTPCAPKWEADKWSECSVSCGSGTQTRQIECRQRFSHSLTLRVSADQCGQDKKPAVAQQCERGLCSTWSVGSWGQCTKDCGGGEKRRDVKCVDGFDSPIPSNYCTEAKPKDREECNNQQCKAQWWTSDWSTLCSESCGSGYQVRSALCMNGDGSVTSESRCRKTDFPDLTKSCYGDNGCRGTWFTGSWGRCSTKCGKGTRRRAVICLQPKAGGNIAVATGKCNPNLKPVGEEPCTNTDCKSLWFTSPWSKCSVMCGDGFKYRDVSCIDRNSNPSEECEPTIKPESQQDCSLESCTLYQRTDGRLAKTYDSSLELDFEEVEDDAKTDKYKDVNEEGNTEKQPQKVKGDDSDIESYVVSRDSKELEVEEEESSVQNFQKYKADSDESQPEVDNTSDKNACKDKHWNCLMVIQSRLCHYDYYKNQCCVSCQALSSTSRHP